MERKKESADKQQAASHTGAAACVFVAQKWTKNKSLLKHLVNRLSSWAHFYYVLVRCNREAQKMPPHRWLEKSFAKYNLSFSANCFIPGMVLTSETRRK
jgi:hypothetical protein